MRFLKRLFWSVADYIRDMDLVSLSIALFLFCVVAVLFGWFFSR